MRPILFFIVLWLGWVPFTLAQPGVSPVKPAGSGESYSIEAARLWPGGDFSLTGNGITIYQWEAFDGSGSHPDTADAQLAGRVDTANTLDGFSSHATEMARIMIGQTGDSTQGVAYNARIRSYSLTDYAQNLNTALLSGMELSNHSFGFNAGWVGTFWYGLEEIDSTEDYNFGRYAYWDSLMDALCYQYPYFVSVQSAGNSRGLLVSGAHQLYRSVNGSTSSYQVVNSSAVRQTNGGADGFDCMPSGCLGKNRLIVGAVQPLAQGWQDTSGVLIQARSSFGPVDDGRIKPDLVAGGAQTSQASAAVSGLLALLKEHYQNLNGRQPLSSTLRGTLIHTAEEAGTARGPDYKHGWGLVNGLAAARQLSNADHLHPTYEDTLRDGDTAVYYFYADTNELKASLCWTDPPGTPVPFAHDPAVLDNSKQMLVNDLDLRLEQLSNNQVYQPYVLDKARPAQGAFQGDNAVDNVEQIDRDMAKKGWHKLTITHKGKLEGGKQVYSLLISGARAALYYDGAKWTPHAPNAHTEHMDVYISENSVVSLSGGLKANQFTIGRGAKVTLN